MKNNLIPVTLLVIVLLFNQCERNGSDPNENWVVGRSWIDPRDDNSYNIVPIGDQVWMAENLAYLPSVNIVADGSEDAGKEQKPFYYVYDYDGTVVSAAMATSNYEQYGVLYNWTAAKTACPDGWHLPTDDEWKELEITLGISSSQASLRGYQGTDEGNKLKATWGWKYNSWKDKYGNGTNETGFTGLPGGSRSFEYADWTIGAYYLMGIDGNWWSASMGSSDEYSGKYIWYRRLSYSRDDIYRYEQSEDDALSIRCVKN
ncbi:MAG: FISUMP domain-containing protein [Bacteroidota bacterium]